MRRGLKYGSFSSDHQRTILAEERTVLAYVRTFVTILGLAIIILKVYFEAGGWVPLFAIFGASIAVIVIIEEIMRHRGKMNHSLEIKIKHNHK